MILINDVNLSGTTASKQSLPMHQDDCTEISMLYHSQLARQLWRKLIASVVPRVLLDDSLADRDCASCVLIRHVFDLQADPGYIHQLDPLNCTRALVYDQVFWLQRSTQQSDGNETADTA